MSFSEAKCLEAIVRAQNAIGSPKALADINRRLGTRVDKIPLVYAYGAGLDRDAESGKNYPVIDVGADARNYLGLDPDIEGVRFRWLMGIWNDPVIGPVPTFFMCSRYQTQERLLALVWSLTKCSDHKWSKQASMFKSFGLDEFTIDIQIRGAEGGYKCLSEMGIIVQRSSGGLDMKTTPCITLAKLWNTLETSVMYNAVDTAFLKSAPTWPYPPELESGIFETPGASGGFKFWY